MVGLLQKLLRVLESMPVRRETKESKVNNKQAEIINEFLEKTGAVVYAEAPQAIQEMLIYIATAEIATSILFGLAVYGLWRMPKTLRRHLEKNPNCVESGLGVLGVLIRTFACLFVYPCVAAFHEFSMVFIAPRFILLKKLARLVN